MASSFLGTTVLPMSSEEMLESASQVIDRHLQGDRRYGDLSDLLKVPTHKSPCDSGLNDFDYPSLADPRVGLASMSELSPVKRVPLPPELVEQFGHMQCNSMMGLLPEISRAWLSIDSDIFVWNYEDGGDLAYFDGLSETILSAGLVRPKPGIFQPHIQYLLCLTTPVDIVLLGVSFSRHPTDPSTDPNIGEMHLLPDPLFSIPTDNTYILNIVGADNGRIFMAGKDGCLYELAYQAEDGWFSRKCRKINHSTSSLSFLVPSFLNFSFADDDPLVQIDIDNSRHILYTRSEKGTLQVYDLGENGQGMSRVAASSLTTIVQNAALVARTIDKTNFKPIVHIAAVEKTESANIHLVAITQSGVRLYFTTNPFNENRGRPSMLSLVHVRLPPGFSASGSPTKPSNIHIAHYKRGTLLAVSSLTEDNDLLWTMSADSFPFQNLLVETVNTTPIDGHTWALSEVPTPSFSLEPWTMDPKVIFPLRPDPPLVVTQHMEPARRFVLLSAQGSHLMNKLRPVDQLRQLLMNNHGPDNVEVQAFFKLHKEDQACATCLILACSKLAVDKQVSEWATRAFFLYGGDPAHNYGGTGSGPTAVQSPYATPGPVTSSAPSNLSFSTLATPAPGIQPNQMSTPNPVFIQQQQSFTSPFQASILPGTQEVLFSGKHDGICLYMSRLLRPLWEYRIVSDFPVNTKKVQKEYLTSRLSSEDLGWFLQQLLDLQEFIIANSQFISPLASESVTPSHTMMRSTLGSQVDEQTKRKYQVDAQNQEKLSMQQIEQLISRIAEVIGLWQILCDHQMHVVVEGLTKDQQNQLKIMTLRNIVTSGKDMCSAMITCLINRYLGDNATTDAISSRLRDVCPSLYSTEDAICSKANEKLQAAKGIQNQFEKDRLLKEALQLYKQIPLQLDLPVVCTQFSSVQFYDGIVDLCLTTASRRDPQMLALHYYKNGQPPEDNQGMQAYIARMDSYKCITEMLKFLVSTSQSHPHAPSVPKTPGPPPALDPNRLSNAEAERYAEQVFKLSLQSEDEMFHVSLYDWLIAEGLNEKLLEVQSPYLEGYLKRSASFEPDNLELMDLLWKYYEKNKHFLAAAKILAKLAERHGTDTTLQKRLEYLSRAIMCAKSSTLSSTGANEGEFLHELEEKMEVARIQLHIYETLSSLHPPHMTEALASLDAQLMDITTLYGDYAEPFGLAECKLAIVHCAGHHDPTLVESLWQDIIEKELSGTIGAPPHSRMATLSNKIIALTKIYGSTERYYPLAFLVKHLEKRSCELNFDHKWVFSTFLDTGINLPKLQEIYDRLFKSKDPYWLAHRKPNHLLYVLKHLLETYAKKPNIVQTYERRHFTTCCLDAMAAYLVELQAAGSDPVLIAELKAVQAKLERL